MPIAAMEKPMSKFARPRDQAEPGHVFRRPMTNVIGEPVTTMNGFSELDGIAPDRIFDRDRFDADLGCGFGRKN